MEITKQQIDKVEKYLENRQFDYIDLKYEVLDHMISDIEKHLNNNISFENAFKITVLKWNKHFEETYSFILKTQYTGAFLLLIGAFVGVFDNNHYLNNVFLGFVLAGYAVVFICNHFYAKHRAIIEKYKFS